MKNHICQSCGMPLFSPEQHGTDKNGMRIEDYCHYCFTDGEFTSDATMEEMIQLCVKYVANNERDEIISKMRMQFPTLKRWAQKEDTQNEYYKSISKVLDYIKEHLAEKPDITTLSQIANISPYHFHRIFKAIIGENLGEYVLRLRLEYVARQLRTTSLSLNELAEQTGYSSQQALSKAFKKYFEVPPSIYKSTVLRNYEAINNEFAPRICKIAGKNIFHFNAISTGDNDGIWKKLYFYAVINRLMNDSAESLELIITGNEGVDFFLVPSLTTKDLIAPNKTIASKTIDGGLYAIFTHKGPYEKIQTLYNRICREWLPASKYELKDTVAFMKFLNNSAEVSDNELLTEIYLPVKENEG